MKGKKGRPKLRELSRKKTKKLGHSAYSAPRGRGRFAFRFAAYLLALTVTVVAVAIVM